MRYLFVLLMFVTVSLQAKTYFVDRDFVVPLNCINPTARADGTPLLLSEIAEITINVYQDMAVHTVSMVGGCAPLDFDLSLLTPGVWNKEFMTVDTGGRVSVIAPGEPFEYAVFVANPNPPIIIED